LVFLELSGQDHSLKALIECIYRPNCNIDYALLINVLREISVYYTHAIITGDLNSNILGKKHLLDSFESIGLFLVNIHIPTLLDLFF